MRRRDAVRVEARAAAIAAQMIHDLRHDMVVEELVGWMRCGDNRERGSDPKSLAWLAGWLAAIIYSHERRDARDARGPRAIRSALSRLPSKER